METIEDYHTRRARDELDRAYRTDSSMAWLAHLRLSALHMDSLRAIARPRPADAARPRPSTRLPA